MSDSPTPESKDSLQEYINLRYEITDPIEAFNLFIKRNLPELYAHFIDSDDNEAEYVRRIVTAHSLAAQKTLLLKLKEQLHGGEIGMLSALTVGNVINFELAVIERQQAGEEQHA